MYSTHTNIKVYVHTCTNVHMHTHTPAHAHSSMPSQLHLLGLLLSPLMSIHHQPFCQQPPHYLINACIGGGTDQEVGLSELLQGQVLEGRGGTDAGCDRSLMVGLRREEGREGGSGKWGK